MRQRIEALTNYFMAHGIPDTATAQHQAVIAIGKLVKRESGIAPPFVEICLAGITG